MFLDWATRRLNPVKDWLDWLNQLQDAVFSLISVRCIILLYIE
jgi:hypothetical protein